MADLNAPGLTQNHNLYDYEIENITRVTARIQQRSQQRRNYEDFDREIRQRFAEIGFKVSVNWHTAQDENGQRIEGWLIPEVVIGDRVEKHEFDHDRQVHEVTNDILDLGTGGVISSNDANALLAKKAHGHKH